MGEALRILQVVHGYPPLEQAGAELCCAFLSQEFQRLGHQVQVLARTGAADLGAYEFREEVVDGVPVRRLRTPTAEADSLRATYLDSTVRARFREVLRSGFDVVHFHHLFGLSADLIEEARSAGAVVVMTLHDFWYLCPRGQRFTPRNHLCHEIQPWRCSLCIAKKRARWAFNAFRQRSWSLTRGFHYLRENLWRRPIEQRTSTMVAALNRAHLCLAPSRFLLEEYRRHGLDPAQSDFSENGIDVGWAAGVASRAAPSGPLRFGFLGSFLPSKGVDLLVEAFQPLPAGRASLHLHGTSLWDGGRFAARLKRRNRHPDVHFPGPFEHDRLPQILSSLDVLVVPSRWFENAPVTLDEAALARLPVVASDHGGLREIVQRRGNGVLFPPGDRQALTRTLQQLMEDPDLWQKLREPRQPVRTVAEQGAELVERYRALLAVRQGADHERR